LQADVRDPGPPAVEVRVVLVDRTQMIVRVARPLFPLPPREHALIDADLAGEFLLRHPKRFAMIEQPMCHCVSILERIK
jgi:hypothetical protein